MFTPWIIRRREEIPAGVPLLSFLQEQNLTLEICFHGGKDDLWPFTARFAGVHRVKRKGTPPFFRGGGNTQEEAVNSYLKGIAGGSFWVPGWWIFPRRVRVPPRFEEFSDL